MSDPHNKGPIDQATIDCWRTNYGLDKRTPAEAAKWWHDNMRGFSPSGCVAALGVALDELDALRNDAERYRYLRDRTPRDVLERSGPDAGCWIDCEASSGPAALTLLTGDDADAAIDAAMLAQRAVGAA